MRGNRGGLGLEGLGLEGFRAKLAKALRKALTHAATNPPG